VLASGMVRALGARGVGVPAGSRPIRALEVIQESHDGRLQITEPEARAKVGAAIRDAWEFYLIARTLPRNRDADLDGKLKVMVQGSDGHHKARDFQFELLTGALFAMADVRSVPAEPDLRFELKNTEWGIAIKRIRSAGKLAPR